MELCHPFSLCSSLYIAQAAAALCRSHGRMFVPHPTRPHPTHPHTGPCVPQGKKQQLAMLRRFHVLVTSQGGRGGGVGRATASTAGLPTPGGGGGGIPGNSIGDLASMGSLEAASASAGATSTVHVIDARNRMTAGCFPMASGVRAVVPAWGAILVVTSGGRAHLLRQASARGCSGEGGGVDVRGEGPYAQEVLGFRLRVRGKRLEETGWGSRESGGVGRD
eukprot:351151-Chlamydomonas_euryale.AAC.11